MLSHPLLEGFLGDARVRRVLDEAEHAYLTIATSSGPHSTPEVHFAWGGRVWLMVANDTVKAKVLRKEPRAAVLARAGDSSVVVVGDAHQVDVTRPEETLRSLPEALLSGPALAGYLGRNQHDLLGFVRGALSGEMGSDLASAPLLIGVRPRVVALVEGAEVAAAEGDWPGRQEAAGRDQPAAGDDPPAVDLRDVPSDAAELLERESPCVVGWSTGIGPVGFPGRWDPARRVATVPAEVFGLAAPPSPSGACVTLDVIEEHRPEGKHGIVLRGEGRATPAGPSVDVRVQADRVTWWRGKKAQTTDVG